MTNPLKGSSVLLPQVIYFVATMTIIILLPNKTFLTYVLAIVTMSLVYKLVDQIKLQTKPKKKEWLTSSVKTVAFTSVFLASFIFLGMFGVLGLVVGVLLLVAWRIWKSWWLFNGITKWGALKVRGRTSEDFDYRRAFEDGKKGKN